MMASLSISFLCNIIIFMAKAEYIFVNETQLTPNAANLYCQNTYNTTLASINSQQDQDYITNNCVPHNSGTENAGCIIGLTDQYDERLDNRTGWHWFDGSPFNYSFWADDEPNQYLGNEEDCVQIWMERPNQSVGSWNDISCNNSELSTANFFCNAPPTSSPTADPTSNPSKHPSVSPPTSTPTTDAPTTASPTSKEPTTSNPTTSSPTTAPPPTINEPYSTTQPTPQPTTCNGWKIPILFTLLQYEQNDDWESTLRKQCLQVFIRTITRLFETWTSKYCTNMVASFDIDSDSVNRRMLLQSNIDVDLEFNINDELYFANFEDYNSTKFGIEFQSILSNLTGSGIENFIVEDIEEILVASHIKPTAGATEPTLTETPDANEEKTALIIGLCVGFTALCLCIVIITYRLFRKEQSKYPQNQRKKADGYMPANANTPVTPNDNADYSFATHKVNTLSSVDQAFHGTTNPQQNGNGASSDIPEHIQKIMNNKNTFEVSQAKKRKPPKENIGLNVYYSKVHGNGVNQPPPPTQMHSAIPSGSVEHLTSPYGANEQQTNVGLQYYYDKQNQKGIHQPVHQPINQPPLVELEEMNGNISNNERPEGEGKNNRLKVQSLDMKKKDSFEMNLTNNAVASDLLMDDIVDDMEADNQIPNQGHTDSEDPEGDDDDEDVVDENMGNYIHTPQ